MTFKRPPGVDVWEPPYVVDNDQYSEEDRKEQEKARNEFIALYGSDALAELDAEIAEKQEKNKKQTR